MLLTTVAAIFIPEVVRTVAEMRGVGLPCGAAVTTPDAVEVLGCCVLLPPPDAMIDPLALSLFGACVELAAPETTTPPVADEVFAL